MPGPFSKGCNMRNATYKHRKIYEAIPRVSYFRHRIARTYVLGSMRLWEIMKLAPPIYENVLVGVAQRGKGAGAAETVR